VTTSASRGAASWGGAHPPTTMAMTPPEAPSPPSVDAQKRARFSHLQGRLRNRQITMEEATELFNVMQEMLRASESARLAVAAQSRPTPVPGAPAKAAPARVAAPAAASDDLFLVGLLAMGAGAGLLAAMTKRISEGPRTAPEAPRRSGTTGSASK